MIIIINIKYIILNKCDFYFNVTTSKTKYFYEKQRFRRISEKQVKLVFHTKSYSWSGKPLFGLENVSLPVCCYLFY